MEDFTQVSLVNSTNSEFPKLNVGLCITIIVRVRVIWYEVLFKLKVSFDVLVIRKKVLLDYSNHIDTHLDVFVEVIYVHRSVTFELCPGEYFIEFWLAYLMFEIPHATYFYRISNFQWWRLIVGHYYSGRILVLW